MKKIKIILSIIITTFIVAVLVTGTIKGVYADNDSSSSTDKFRISNKTLTAYVGNDALVTIPNDVMIIGERAFEEKEDITAIEFPDYLTEIGYKAFYNCTGLTDITIKNTVTKVGPGAFMGCENIEHFEIGKSVKSWGSGVFNNCNSLKELILHVENNYLTYWDGALYNGDMSFLYQVLPGREGENYVVPSEVINIDTYALYNLQNVENIRFACEIEALGDYALKNLGSVKNVILPESLNFIGKKALADNENLEQVYIPESVSNIAKDAFDNTENVSILTKKGSYAEEYAKKYDIPVIYEKIYPIDFADSNPSGEKKPDLRKKIVLDTGVEALTDEIKKEEEEAKNEDTVENKEQTSGISFEDTVTESTNVLGKATVVNNKAVLLMNNHTMKVYGKPSKNSGLPGTGITDLKNAKAEVINEKSTVDYNLKTLLQRTYYMDNTISKYEIEDDIQNIGRLCFAKSSIQSVVIPDSVENIEYGAFYECDKLTNIEIGANVNNIATKVFEGTAWLSNWKAGLWGEDDFLIIGDGILLSYRGSEESISIPNSVKQIGPEAFKGNDTLVEVYIPASVTKICTDAFKKCTSLDTVTGCKGLKTIVHGAFADTAITEEF